MKKYKVYIILFLIVAVFCIAVRLITSISISDISCRSQYGECSQPIKEKLENVRNCRLLACKKNIDTVLSGVWLVDDYRYQLKLPPKIEVFLVEKKPKYSITSRSLNLSAQLDSEGMVLDIREDSKLPGYIIEGNLPNPGTTVSEGENFALQLIYGASLIQDIEKSTLEDNLLSVDMVGGINILFPLDGDRDFILGSLALILNQLKKESLDSKIESGQISIIDLRYKNPVLR